jgi:hypothetical protein
VPSGTLPLMHIDLDLDDLDLGFLDLQDIPDVTPAQELSVEDPGWFDRTRLLQAFLVKSGPQTWEELEQWAARSGVGFDDLRNQIVVLEGMRQANVVVAKRQPLRWAAVGYGVKRRTRA